MKFIKKNLSAIILVVLFSVIPLVSFAQGVGVVGNGNPATGTTPITNPIGKITTIQEFLRVLVTAAIKLGIPVVALAIIYTGFLFVKAQGAPEELTKAKEALLYTLIGAGILLGAWAITQMVFDTVKTLSS